MIKLIAVSVFMAVVAPAQAAEFHTESEFLGCATRAANYDFRKAELSRQITAYNTGSSDFSADELNKKIQDFNKYVAEFQICHSKAIDTVYVAMYCPESEYDSEWCRDLLAAPEVKARQADLKEAEKWFTSCAGRAVDLEGQREQYERRLGWYNTGLTQITYSEIEGDRVALVKASKKFNKECSEGKFLPKRTIQSICSHPAYQSEWCASW